MQRYCCGGAVLDALLNFTAKLVGNHNDWDRDLRSAKGMKVLRKQNLNCSRSNVSLDANRQNWVFVLALKKHGQEEPK